MYKNVKVTLSDNINRPVEPIALIDDRPLKPVALIHNKAVDFGRQ